MTVDRRTEQEDTTRNYGPRHATTFGANSSEPDAGTSTGAYPHTQLATIADGEINPIEASAHSEDTTKTLLDNSAVIGKSSATDNSGVVKRRSKLRFWKKEEEEEPEVGGLEKTPSRLTRNTDRDITVAGQIRAVLFPQLLSINWLLLLVPAGFAVFYAHVDGKIVFVINFLAIIPLAGILSYATEEIAMRVGETLGGLLNATFG